ncbi:MAG TPA: RpoL/Rpb11 RNA polymerase subunit family protein [Acidobacteriota bacterium]|nr:RpoL/Rpb11 RNA polymerase subunit family protein [Acidobacteriota bacterium]
MEFIVSEHKKNRFQSHVAGADHTVMNVLANEMWQDKSTVASACTLEHPLVAKPKIVIDTDGKDPVDGLLEAVKRVKKKNAEFAKAFDAQ